MWPKIKTAVWETIKFAVVTLAIVIPIRTFVAQPFIVSGSSMEPTFENRQYLIIDELSYFFREPARGEVVIFRYPQDPSKHFIKRIIGLPNETVMIRNDRVAISKDGEQIELDESYLARPFQTNLEVNLGPREYFVMGDNRPVSLDSRVWGPLPRELITGRVFLRLFPPQAISLLPGQPDAADR